MFAIHEDGSTLWQSRLPEWLSYSAAVAPDGTIFVPAVYDYLYAVRPDGTLKWQHQIDYPYQDRKMLMPAIAADGTIYTSSDTLPTLIALNPDGSVKWNAVNAVRDRSPCVGGDGTIYECAGYNVIALNPDGSRKWTQSVNIHQLRTAPMITRSGNVIVIQEYGACLAFH